MSRNFSVFIKDRDLNYDRGYPISDDLSFVVNRYSHNIEGGPKEASITIYGSEGSLWTIFDMLRCPVEIYNHNGTCVWWGFIEEAEIRTSWIVAKASLTDMYNSVGVAFSDLNVRKTTEFLQDDFSVDLYGEKQYRLSMSESSTEQAESRQAVSLSITKFPVADVSFASEGEGSLSATIVCRGWIDTLEWMYYSQSKGLVQHTEGGSGRIKVGYTLNSTSIMLAGSTLTSSACASELFDTGDVVLIYNSASGNNGTYQVLDKSSVNVPNTVADVQAASVSDGPHTTSSVDFGSAAASAAGLFWVLDFSRPNGDEEISASIQGSPDGSSWTTAYEFQNIDAVGRNSDTGASIGRYRRVRYSFDGGGTKSASFLVGSGSVPGTDLEIDRTFPSRESYGGNMYVTTGSKIAQRFTQFSGSSWDASRIYLRVQPAGSPTDYLIVRILSGCTALTSTCPGAILASGCIAASDLTGDMEWQSIPLSACVALVTNNIESINNNNYWLQVDRDLSRESLGSASHHYIVDVDEDSGYQYGFLLVNAGSQWNNPVPQSDMLFKVVGTQRTDIQIKQIVEADGQFIRNVDNRTDSDIETNQYRVGDNTALYEIEQLASTGTADGKRVMLKINKERTFSIIEEPISSTKTNYSIDADRTLKNANGQEVDLSECFYGGWLNLGNVIPPNRVGFVSGLTEFFVEEGEYYPESNTYVPRSRGTKDPWDVSDITEG